MEKTVKRGMSNLILLLIIIGLSFVAYIILKKKITVQELERQEEENLTIIEESIQKENSEKVPPLQSSETIDLNTNSLSYEEEEDLFEQEMSLIEIEINDLMFEDLAFE